jgi:gliding motility-associated-like protein
VGATSSTFTYTLSGTAPCINDTSVATVTISATPVATATPALEIVCSSESTGIVLSSNLAGVTFSWTVSQIGATGASAGSGNNISQVLTATGRVLGDVVYEIIPTLNGCPGTPITATVVVIPKIIAVATPNQQSICSGSTTVAVVLSSNVPGTTYTWQVVQSYVTGATSESIGSTTFTPQTLTLLPGYLSGEAIYYVTPHFNGCDGDPITVVVNVKPIPTATISGTSAICSGTTTDITFTGTPNAIVTYTVNSGGNQTVVLNASGNAIVTTPVLTANSTYALVSVASAGTPSCSQALTGSAIVTVNPTPGNFGDSSISPICSGDTAVISLLPNIANTMFTWTVLQTGVSGAFDGTGTSIGLNPYVISQNLSTTQDNVAGTVVYTITPTLSTGCSGRPFKITVVVNPLPLPTLTDGFICVNQATGSVFLPYTLDTGFNGGYSFEWFYDLGLGPVLIPSATGSTYVVNQAFVGVPVVTYSVRIKNNVTLCVGTASATVTESYPVLSMDALVSNMFSDTPTITVAGGNSSSLYQLDNGPLQASNVFAPVTLGLHVVTITDVNGCTYITKEVFVIGYPHYFTPNGDGINDTWNIIGLNDQNNAKIYIFDRYGKLIKQISTTSPGWDGTFNGELLPSTDYWFTVDYFEGTSNKVFKAHFSLKR